MFFCAKPAGTLLCLLLLAGRGLANPTVVDIHDDEHREEDDHDHDHDHEDEDSFTHLTEITGASVEGYIDDAAFHNLTEKLLMRFHECTGDCAQCLSLSGMKTFLGVDQASSFNFTEETFSVPAQIIIETLLREECASFSDNVTHPNISYGVSSENDVAALLQRLKPEYEAEHDVTTCFNAHTLFEMGLKGDNLTYQLLVNFFEGQCIFPTDHEMEESLFHHFGVEGQDVSDTVYATLLADLGIGTQANSTTTSDGGDSHDGHDHARRRRSLEDHVIRKRQADDDHDHEHGEEEITQCFTGEQLKSIHGLSGNLTRTTLLSMCPAFLQQIVSGSCRAPVVNATTAPTDTNYTDAQRYGYGTVAVALISLLAFVGILFFPVVATAWFKLVMQFFIALGVGTLSGDAILHIVPEIVGLHAHTPGEEGHDHENEDRTYVWRLLVVVAGIWVLFLFENLIKIILGRKRTSSQVHSSIDAHCHVTKFTEGAPEANGQSNGDVPMGDEKKGDDNVEPPVCGGLNTICIMVFIGDILHNFGDGIAIGAAFSVSWVQGIGTSLAIFCHELPHEFGDFAIYLRNGLSKWRALLLNFLAACCAFIGLYIGIAISSDAAVRTWLLAVVGGMFLYIAFVNVLHEMVQDETDYPVAQFVCQNLGMIVGWVIMLILSLYEDQLINSISA